MAEFLYCVGNLDVSDSNANWWNVCVCTCVSLFAWTGVLLTKHDLSLWFSFDFGRMVP